MSDITPEAVEQFNRVNNSRPARSALICQMCAFYRNIATAPVEMLEQALASEEAAPTMMEDKEGLEFMPESFHESAEQLRQADLATFRKIIKLVKTYNFEE